VVVCPDRLPCPVNVQLTPLAPESFATVAVNWICCPSITVCAALGLTVTLIVGLLEPDPPLHPFASTTPSRRMIAVRVLDISLSLVVSSIVDSPESTDVGAKWLAAQWWGYGLYVFWF
jgi:hypothetical protein